MHSCCIDTHLFDWLIKLLSSMQQANWTICVFLYVDVEYYIVATLFDDCMTQDDIPETFLRKAWRFHAKTFFLERKNTFKRWIVHDYIFTKTALATKIVKILSLENYYLYGKQPTLRGIIKNIGFLKGVGTNHHYKN